MNHSVPGVNAGYITRSKLLNDHLRQQQEMISRKMIQAARPKFNDQNLGAAKWPFLPSRRVLKDILKAAEAASGPNNTNIRDEILLTSNRLPRASG
jgi:hypothetical protein